MSADQGAVNDHELKCQGMYGLLPGMSQEEYKLDPGCLLSEYNNKIETMIGRSAQWQVYVLCVLDSGAGPNLIRSGLVSPQTRSRIVRVAKVVNLANASKHRLYVIGILPFIATIGAQTTRTTLSYCE